MPVNRQPVRVALNVMRARLTVIGFNIAAVVNAGTESEKKPSENKHRSCSNPLKFGLKQPVLIIK